MTPNELKIVNQTLKGLADAGLLSPQTMEQIAGLKDTPAGAPALNLVTRKQAGELLQVTGQTLINYAKAGKLKAIKLAGRSAVRYKLEDIENLAKN